MLKIIHLARCSLLMPFWGEWGREVQAFCIFVYVYWITVRISTVSDSLFVPFSNTWKWHCNGNRNRYFCVRLTCGKHNKTAKQICRSAKMEMPDASVECLIRNSGTYKSAWNIYIAWMQCNMTTIQRATQKNASIYTLCKQLFRLFFALYVFRYDWIFLWNISNARATVNIKLKFCLWWNQHANYMHRKPTHFVGISCESSLTIVQICTPVFLKAKKVHLQRQWKRTEQMLHWIHLVWFSELRDHKCIHFIFASHSIMFHITKLFQKGWASH